MFSQMLRRVKLTRNQLPTFVSHVDDDDVVSRAAECDNGGHYDDDDRAPGDAIFRPNDQK